MATKVTSDGRIVLSPGASLRAFDVLPQQAPGANRMHTHHAFQLIVAAGGLANIRTDEGLSEGPVVLVSPDQPHSIEADGRIALLFLEPESPADAGLRRLLGHRPIASLPAMSEVVAALACLWNSPSPTDDEVARLGDSLLERLFGPPERDATRASSGFSIRSRRPVRASSRPRRGRRSPACRKAASATFSSRRPACPSGPSCSGAASCKPWSGPRPARA